MVVVVALQLCSASALDSVAPASWIGKLVSDVAGIGLPTAVALVATLVSSTAAVKAMLAKKASGDSADFDVFLKALSEAVAEQLGDDIDAEEIAATLAVRIAATLAAAEGAGSEAASSSCPPVDPDSELPVGDEATARFREQQPPPVLTDARDKACS